MKILGYILAFVIAVFALIPTKNLFFLMQKELASQQIIVNVDKIGEFPFDLGLNNVDIFYKNIKVSHVDNINLLALIVFNKIDIKNIKINFQNLFIKYLDVKISIFNPLKIYIKGKGNFGDIDGIVNLKDRILKVYIINLKNNNIKYFLKKDKKGYFYATKF